MLFGEITITLDDVASLLHLPISNVEAHPLYEIYMYISHKNQFNVFKNVITKNNKMKPIIF
jgi:hypothetical protein